MLIYVINIILSLVFLAVTIISSDKIPNGLMPLLLCIGIGIIAYSIYMICQKNEKIKGIVLGILYAIGF